MNGGGRRKMGAPLSNRSKDRDEDLVMFRDMYKRDKDRVVSLLQPVSDEFEPNGNYPLYGAKKGPAFGFPGESEKNDYDWLKTPPATPLFPSLEMETKNAHELVVQRELPIIQPLSRFAGKQETELKQKSTGAIPGRSKTPGPKPRIPARSVTPSGRSTSLFTDQKKNIKTAPIQLTNVTDNTKKLNKPPFASKPLTERDNRLDFLGANLSKSMQGTNSSSRTVEKSRGVSPLITSRIPTQIQGFSDETPVNLKTDRSSSTTRGRPVSQSQSQSNVVGAPQKPKIYRQSCSPSVTRGRKVAPTHEETLQQNKAIATQKGSNRMFQTGNGGQVFGSRMVDKIMNARKTSVEEKETKMNLNGSINEGSGYGRIMSKGSLDVGVKHMEAKQDPVNSRHVGISSGRRSISTTYAPSSKSTGGNYRV